MRTVPLALFASTLLLPLLSFSCGPNVRQVRPAEEYGQNPAPAEAPEQASSRPRPKPISKIEPSDVPDERSRVRQPVVRKLARLSAFYDAVDALRNGKRESSVRIFWLGDSHTAADFMTQPVREHLIQLGGDGGPGFVRLGLDGYRHGAVRVKPFGRWRKAPILPAQRTRVLDGVFGYGGIRTLPAAAAGVTIALREPKAEPLRWTLSLRLVHSAKVDFQLGEQKLRVAAAERGAGSSDEAPAALDEVVASADNTAGPTLGAVPTSSTLPGGGQAVHLSGSGTDEMSVYHVGGDPEIFGAFGDYEAPGIVLDTVGINGARTATPLAWEPEQFVAQVAAREPDLLVLAFGTNEVFDQTRPERYVEHNEQLVGLVRRARPDIPCWIIGPPDSSTKEGTSKARVSEVTAAQEAAADKLGCAFTSAYELMGGEGSFNRWAREKPAKARGDRIHLTIAGYTELGRLLSLALIDGSPLEDARPNEGQGAGDTPSATDSPEDEQSQAKD